MSLITPQLKDLWSPDLMKVDLPPDPYDCVVFVQAVIGPADNEGMESFSFTVITVQALTKHAMPFWPRSHLVLEEFSWEVIRNALTWRLNHCRRESWHEIAKELSKYMEWEFDDYRD